MVPEGAAILKGMARQYGVCEASRSDIVVTVFIVPGQEPAWLVGLSPSKSTTESQVVIYRLGASEFLVVENGSMSAVSNWLGLYRWNIRQNRIEELWELIGEECCEHMTHTLCVCEGRPHLTIFGIAAVKLPAYKKEERLVSERLGFPVEFKENALDPYLE
jgi:hypothetical protein